MNSALADAYNYLKTFDIEDVEEKAVCLLHLADKRAMNRYGRTITGYELPIAEEIGEAERSAEINQKCPFGYLAPIGMDIIREICEVYQNCTLDELSDAIGEPARTLHDFFRGHPYGEFFIEDMLFDRELVRMMAEEEQPDEDVDYYD